MAAVPLRLGPVGALPAPTRLVLDAGRRYRLTICDVGLACCAVEVGAAALTAAALTAAARTTAALAPAAATTAAAPAPPAGAPAPAGEPDRAELDVLLVAGTVTDVLAPALLALHQQLPRPCAVVSFGACSNTGGPYWDSYCVTKGVDQVLPVDLYVPGCPPRPEALLHALDGLPDPEHG